MTRGWEEIEDELSDGDIHIHDKMQFELKTEYIPIPGVKENKYVIEFFVFIPSALQVNRHTYLKSQFYLDQTSLIRFKTPVIPLSDLIASNGPQSPLYRIEQMYQFSVDVNEEEVLKELKLFANIARSALRLQVHGLEERLRHNHNTAAHADLEQEICQFCAHCHALRRTYLSFQERHQHWWHVGKLREYSQYIDEFLSMATERYLATLLDLVHEQGEEKFPYAVADLKEQILHESAYRAHLAELPVYLHDPEREAEYRMYRQSLLKKFVWEVLFLSIERKEPGKTFREVIAAGAAGLAMFIYLYGLAYYGLNMVLNSTAFIMVAVMLYVLKDRIKDALKNSSAKLASRWLPDYTTLIRTPDGKTTLGVLKEFFTFLSPEQVPSEIWKIRNTEFHSTLDQARRMEEVLYYRKEVTLYPPTEKAERELVELNDIFRLNIAQFLLKASDPYKEQLQVDPETGQLQKVMSPKVYHVNILIRQTFKTRSQEQRVVLKKYRIVLDKEGVKRLEKIESRVQSSTASRSL